MPRDGGCIPSNDRHGGTEPWVFETRLMSASSSSSALAETICRSQLSSMGLAPTMSFGQNRKAHQNGIKKPKKERFMSMQIVDPKFLKNLCSSKKHNKRHVKINSSSNNIAKSKNHTNHIQNRKAHQNGIKKPKKERFMSMQIVDPKFLKNLCSSKKHNKRHVKINSSSNNMAKSKNHTNYIQNRKAHQNGIKKSNKERFMSMQGVDPMFLRNLRPAKKHDKRHNVIATEQQLAIVDELEMEMTSDVYRRMTAACQENVAKYLDLHEELGKRLTNMLQSEEATLQKISQQ
ncbi:unnamed protein product [Heligmosomoides polygyrus]|uniref:Large ribosomal subunit protein eL29 n=1 Tax=Heligmosomoides polygyrus TaxID=6339 RepID=A0A183FDK1_HELPZ|nr:unnamed protein product [Heligmosomoides polygyrus]